MNKVSIISVLFFLLSLFFCDITKAEDQVDYKIVSEQYERRYLNGDCEAAYMIGFLHNSSKLPNSSIQTAFNWYLKSAKLGCPKSQKKVSEFYELGVGTIENFTSAYMWLIISEINLDPDVRSKLRLQSKMPMDSIIKAQSLARICFDSNFKNCENE